MKKLNECPVCGSKSISQYLTTHDYFLTQETFSLCKCSSCGFVFTNPRPEIDKLGVYYDSEKYLSHHAKSMSPLAVAYGILRKVNIRYKYNLISKFVTRGSLLDIGCGTGELLHYFNNNAWKTMGIEPNESARNFGKTAYKLEVVDEVELNNLPEKNFDVVSMWHVLEHVPLLNQRLNEAKRLLSDNGILVIALPNIASWDAQYYGRYWAALDVPRHLYHFTPQSFKTLAKYHGLNIIHKFPMKMDAFYVSLLSERYRNSGFTFLKAFGNGIKSNKRAKRTGDYSSIIYFLKK